MELCQLDKIYVNDLIQYNRALMQRNQLLKDISFHPDLADTLEMWDMQLVRFGRGLIRARKAFVEEMNLLIREIHGELSGGREELSLCYEPDVDEEELAGRLISLREQEIRQKTTLSGPHRDDVGFVVNGINVRKFGSQGQQRTCALALKLAEIELVKRRIRDNPVLLLDDVLSELDSGRQENLLKAIRGTQTFITCTGLDDFVNRSFRIDRLFRASMGHVETGT